MKWKVKWKVQMKMTRMMLSEMNDHVESVRSEYGMILSREGWMGWTMKMMVRRRICGEVGCGVIEEYVVERD